MESDNNVINFAPRIKNPGLKEYLDIISKQIGNDELTNIVAIAYSKESEEVEIYVVGDFATNELLGDLELLKHSILND